MIVYTKLGLLLQKRKMSWSDLRKAGLSQNMPTRFSKNENINGDTLNKVCEYLKVQPSEIMEWIPDEEYNKANAEIASIEAQIAELEAKKKQLQSK
jgi:DNA-binding Xre family transcriptional regulator